MQFGGQSTVDAQKLLVHHRGEREVAERVHDGVVDGFGVFVLAFWSA
jgi:hypothetical protein